MSGDHPLKGFKGRWRVTTALRPATLCKAARFAPLRLVQGERPTPELGDARLRARTEERATGGVSIAGWSSYDELVAAASPEEPPETDVAADDA